VQAVNQFSQLPEAVALAAANKRVANILAKQLGDTAPGAVQSALLQEPAEQALASAIELLSEEIEPLVQQRDYSGILQKLAQLREPVDEFFDQVMVMADDQSIRNNRLALLFSLRQLFINVADISQLIPSK
jgi:glycyl-tRNA synthetase beta chain